MTSFSDMPTLATISSILCGPNASSCTTLVLSGMTGPPDALPDALRGGGISGLLMVRGVGAESNKGGLAFLRPFTLSTLSFRSFSFASFCAFSRSTALLLVEGGKARREEAIACGVRMLGDCVSRWISDVLPLGWEVRGMGALSPILSCWFVSHWACCRLTMPSSSDSETDAPDKVDFSSCAQTSSGKRTRYAGRLPLGSAGSTVVELLGKVMLKDNSERCYEEEERMRRGRFRST